MKIIVTMSAISDKWLRGRGVADEVEREECWCETEGMQ